VRAPVELLLTPDERQRYNAQLRDFKERLLPDIQRQRLHPESDDADALDDLNDASSFVLGTIEVLEEMLPRAGTLSSEAAATADYVRLGSRVRVKHQDGTERVYVIGLTLYDLPPRNSGLRGVTWDSGVALALRGKRAGESGVVKAPVGKYKLTVLSIEQPTSSRP
jgi:transcription elongation GreA/GreB family factor